MRKGLSMSDDKYIQSLVFLVCDKGSLVTPFIATPKKEDHHGITGGTTRDNIPLLNIMPFALCTIDRILCIPLMPEWKRYPESPVVIENFHPLLLSSYCKCQKGGTIKVFETYKEAAEYLASVSESRVNGYGWLDETICGILSPGMVLMNRIMGKKANNQAVGRGFRQGLLNTWEGIKSLGKAETWKGLGNLAAIAVVGYSSPIPGVLPEMRLVAFDSVFKTNLADTDMAMKLALAEAVDQKLINGTEVEHHEFIGQAMAAVLEAAVGTKGTTLVVKGVAQGGKAALGLQRYAALVNRMNQFRNSLKWSKFKDIRGIFRKKKIYRQDSFPFSPQGKTGGRLKSYIDEDGSLNPAKLDGKATIKDHIRGSEPLKSESPYTSFSSDKPGSAKKVYGDKTIELDIKKLEADIKNGKVKDVEIIDSKDVQKTMQKEVDIAKDRYDKNPTEKNAKRLENAERDLENTTRDNEILIKGKVPEEYLKIK